MRPSRERRLAEVRGAEARPWGPTMGPDHGARPKGLLHGSILEFLRPNRRVLENLHIALDVSANGRLNLPPYAPQSPSQIHNISIFLYSYSTGKNFTVTNVTTSTGGALGDIMSQEPGSTVKHINWRWPDCLVGDGQPRRLDDVRGAYNVSI
jgi:hypothetical protein